MTNILTQRIRNNQNQPRGILLAKKLNDTSVGIGWAVCKNTDVFDKELGIKIAMGRATKFHASIPPHSIQNEFGKFVERCQRYFKGQTILIQS